MTKSAEEKKRIEDAQMEDARVRGEKKFREEDVLKRIAAEEAMKQIAPGKEKKVKFTPAPTTNKKDWEAILGAYKKQFGLEPNEKGILVFPSPEAAVKFFTDMAKEGRTFFATKCDANDKLTDYHFFACGDGVLYKGTYAEIKSALTAAVQSAPENKVTLEGLNIFNALMPTAPNPAAQMRGAIQDQRKAPEESPEAAHTPKPPTR